MESSSESSEAVDIVVVLRQGLAIARKNLDNHLSNKKRLLGELLIPGLVCTVYIAFEGTPSTTQRLKKATLSSACSCNSCLKCI